MKEIGKIVQSVLTDVDASITAYIAQILHESLNKNQINDSKHILHILQNSLIEYQICESSSQCNKICVSIFEGLIKNDYIPSSSIMYKMLHEFAVNNPKSIMARYTADGQWYKANIINTEKDDSKSNTDTEYDIKVNVIYSGYGNTEWVDITDIAYYDSWFNVLHEMKEQAKLKQMMEEKMAEESESDTDSNDNKPEYFDEISYFHSVECFRLLGTVFLLYLDDSSINELLEMGIIDNNLLPIHENDGLRRKLSNRDWSDRINTFKQKYYGHKKVFNVEHAMTTKLCPFYSLFKVYKVTNPTLLHGLYDNDYDQEVNYKNINEMSARCKILCAMLLNVNYSKKTKHLNSVSNSGLAIEIAKTGNFKGLINENGNISQELMKKLTTKDVPGNSLRGSGFVTPGQRVEIDGVGKNFSRTLMTRMIKITRKFDEEEKLEMDVDADFSRDKVIGLKFQHALEFDMQVASHVRYRREDLIKISGRLISVEDLDEIGIEWLSVIKEDLRKLFVTKLLNIKQYFVADLKVDVDNKWGKNSFHCVIVFAWCYDNCIFVWHDFLQK